VITEQAHIIVFTPHPDDAESRMAGTVARWVREGKNIVYMVCTNGDKGTNDPNMKPEELARIRERAVGCRKATWSERGSVLVLSRPGARRYTRVQKRDCTFDKDV